MTVAVKIEVAADPFAAMRALNRIRAEGFAMELDGNGLVVSPADRLSAEERACIRQHKAGLVALLMDAAELHAVLVQAGPAGLWWMEGTPGWDNARLMGAGEVLYGNGLMVNRNDRRFFRACAPRVEFEAVDVEAIEERAAIRAEATP